MISIQQNTGKRTERERSNPEVNSAADAKDVDIKFCHEAWPLVLQFDCD